MKKLITIIILALLIATAGAEETVYRKMTAEELVKYMYEDTGAVREEYSDFPVIVTGVVWLAYHLNNKWTIYLLGYEGFTDEPYGIGLVTSNTLHMHKTKPITLNNYPNIKEGQTITFQADTFYGIYDRRNPTVVLYEPIILSIE